MGSFSVWFELKVDAFILLDDDSLVNIKCINVRDMRVVASHVHTEPLWKLFCHYLEIYIRIVRSAYNYTQQELTRMSLLK